MRIRRETGGKEEEREREREREFLCLYKVAVGVNESSGAT
jgi:hypothetical protein